ncbi:MAG: L-dopachrome tautomerase-related protein, partial [Tepidisphaeraceae bacterium]
IPVGCSQDKDDARGLPAQAGSSPAYAGPTTAPQSAQLVSSARLAQGQEPMNVSVVQGGPAQGKTAPGLQPVAYFFGAMPTGVTVTPDGKRIFLCFPRWSDPVNYTVAELTQDGRLTPFPDAQANQYDSDHPAAFDPAEHLVSVQSVVVDPKNRLWLVDTGSINLGPIIHGAPKLVCYDLTTGRRVKVIRFGDAVLNNTYLNDIRFDLSRGAEGYAYLTDSGAGGIVVVDIGTGESWRKLSGNPAVLADPQFVPNVEGQPLMKRPPGKRPTVIGIKSDGIAISPDRKTLYFSPLASRKLWAVSTDALADRSSSEATVAKTLRLVAERSSGSDGLICDSQGNVLATGYEDGSIKRYAPTSQAGDAPEHMLLQDQHLIWPDTLSISQDVLYFTVNQLNRQGSFHEGQDQRVQPYVLYKFPLKSAQ